MHNVTDVMLRRRTRQHRSLLFRYILVQSIYIYDVCVCESFYGGNCQLNVFSNLL